MNTALKSLSIGVLSTMLLLASVAASAQTAPPLATPPPAKEQPDESWEEKWLMFSNSWVTARWGWLGIMDGAAMTQDSANEGQVGHVPAKGEPRADRFLLGGTLKFAKPWKYLIGANYNGLDSSFGEAFAWMDLSLDIPLTSWLGSVNIGRQKIGVAQEWIMPGSDMVFMERSAMDLAFVPQRNIGIRLHNTFANGRATYSAGAFNDWFVKDRSMSANGNQYTGRVSFLPVDRDAGKTIVSVATSVYYKEDTEGTLQYRSRPEVNQSPYFADTGKFAADHSTSTKFEINSMRGSTLMFGEWTITAVDAPTMGQPFFHGGFVGGSYVLTGEARPYNRNGGFYSAVKPRSPFSFRNGGRGAWEVAARYSYIDLTDAAVDGGVMGRVTGAVSWYPNDYWRFEFNYGHGVLDRADTKGHFNVFQARAQFGF
jgi:phosphate-selective porin OprO/OprP